MSHIVPLTRRLWFSTAATSCLLYSLKIINKSANNAALHSTDSETKIFEEEYFRTFSSGGWAISWAIHYKLVKMLSVCVCCLCLRVFVCVRVWMVTRMAYIVTAAHIKLEILHA